MVILLPLAAAALPQLEQTFTTEAFDSVLARLAVQRIELFLPRFELASDLALAPPLERLGLRTVWYGQKADFSAIGSKRMFVTSVVQRATIAVDETGTVAAAATRSTVGFGEAPKLPVMRVNRPFLFILRHRPSGTILFLGRVADPRGTP
jgi:serpin B